MRLRVPGILLAAALAVPGLTGCAEEPPSVTYLNLETGRACDPNPRTLRVVALAEVQGDNADDPHSDRIDCTGDGNSGEGDDWRTCLCDDALCCQLPPHANTDHP